MKKILALALALVMMLGSVAALADGVTIGQVQFAAHGTKCFAVITVAMQDGKIAAAYIDEFQFMSPEGVTPVPNSDTGLASYVVEGSVLISKRLNNETYSNNMATKAGATKTLLDGYQTIEAFVVGMSIEELETLLNGNDSASMIDVVSGATLVDTYGYLQGILAAAKAAQ